MSSETVHPSRCQRGRSPRERGEYTLFAAILIPVVLYGTLALADIAHSGTRRAALQAAADNAARLIALNASEVACTAGDLPQGCSDAQQICWERMQDEEIGHGEGYFDAGIVKETTQEDIEYVYEHLGDGGVSIGLLGEPWVNEEAPDFPRVEVSLSLSGGGSLIRERAESVEVTGSAVLYNENGKPISRVCGDGNA